METTAKAAHAGATMRAACRGVRALLARPAAVRVEAVRVRSAAVGVFGRARWCSSGFGAADGRSGAFVSNAAVFDESGTARDEEVARARGAGSHDEQDMSVLEFPAGTKNKPVGVRYYKNRRKWGASMKIRGVDVYLGTFSHGQQAARVRKEAEALVAQGCDASGVREALGLPPPRALKRRGATGVYLDRGVWRARFQRGGTDHYLGSFESKEAALAAYEEAHAEFDIGDGKYAGWVEFVADTNVEVVADDPDTADFPHGTINRPVGLRLNKNTRKWAASIRIAGEDVHLGTFANGSDAAAVRDEAATIMADGADADALRHALHLPQPGQRGPQASAPGFYMGKSGAWVARVSRRGKVVELGRHDTQDAAREAYKKAVATFAAADKRAARNKVSRFLSRSLGREHAAAAAVHTAAGATAATADGMPATSGDSGDDVTDASSWDDLDAEALALLDADELAELQSDDVCEPAHSRELFELADGQVPWDDLHFPLGTVGKPQGLRLRKATGRWSASITVDRHVVNLGTFDDGERAADIRSRAKALVSGGVTAAELRAALRLPARGGARSSHAVGSSDISDSSDSSDSSDISDSSDSSDISDSSDSSDSGDFSDSSGSGSGSASDSDVDSDSEDDEVMQTQTNFPPAELMDVDTTPRHRLPRVKVPREPVEGVMGVWKRPEKGGAGLIYEALLMVHGTKVSGGVFETVEEAAYAYDALVRMYQGPEAATNYSEKSYTTWLPPDTGGTTAEDLIPTLPGKQLTVEEVVGALTDLSGVDVKALDLTGRSDLAEHMVFVTGRSVPHMRKLADTIVKALRLRGITPNGNVASVEGRECDDWMVVDASNIIVNVMDEEARECFDFETFYGNMKIGVDPWDGVSYDEWLEMNPIPEQWLQRLERDELED